jgi:oxygen-dependent protoporphyrinogen oxidase
VTLVTLVADAPGWDAAPRGTGLLVAPDAPGVDARALTHLTAKWEWVAEALPGRHAVRLSYDGVPDDAVATATRDAGILLGSPLRELHEATRYTWERVTPRLVDGVVAGGDAPADMLAAGDALADDVLADDVVAVGETVSGTGLASVVPHAERIAREITGA